ncbi:hypothetical protein Btru_050813 [Bulinus truncatus]|nr:hypothetical protein Btru_050813 [Bulinus truncatus]
MGQFHTATIKKGMGQFHSATIEKGMTQFHSATIAKGMGQFHSATIKKGMGQFHTATIEKGKGQFHTTTIEKGMGQFHTATIEKGMGQFHTATRERTGPTGYDRVIFASVAILSNQVSFSAIDDQIALAFGLSIMALVQMIGHVSGGHINSAVTIAMAVAMNITILRAVLYIIAQVIGAVVGGFILKGLTPELARNGLATTSLGRDVTVAQGFGVELILTFVLVAVIFGTTDPNRASFGSASLLIGLTVTVGHLAGIKYTGSSMNPTRSLGSAVASGIWDDHWVYWVGPIAGGVIAALVYKLVLNPYRGVTNMEEAINKLRSELPTQSEDISLKTVGQ